MCGSGSWLTIRVRHSVAGRKSDHGEAVVLANILRTDSHAHRPLPADSELVQAIAVLARAQQDAAWARTTAHNKLRSHLREYYAGFFAASPTPAAGSPGPRHARSWPPHPTRPTPRSSPGASSRRYSAAPDARAASAPRLPGCVRRCASRRCGNYPWSSRPWVDKRSPCSASSTPPVPPQTTLSGPSSRPSTSMPTPTSSPASPDSVRSPAPVCSPRSATTGPDPRRQSPQGLRRGRADHPRQRQEQQGAASTGQEQPAQRRGIHLGVLRAHRVTRRTSPLRPPSTGRRPARRRAAQPLRTPARLSAPLPEQRPALPRTDRLPDTKDGHAHPRGLTR